MCLYYEQRIEKIEMSTGNSEKLPEFRFPVIIISAGINSGGKLDTLVYTEKCWQYTIRVIVWMYRFNMMGYNLLGKFEILSKTIQRKGLIENLLQNFKFQIPLKTSSMADFKLELEEEISLNPLDPTNRIQTVFQPNLQTPR